jgi:hypothetical protein
MPAGLDELLHNAAVLFRFADFIEEYCREQARSQRYVDASGEFFRYAGAFASAVKKYVRRNVELAGRFHKRVETIRPHLVGLSKYLQLLHTVIKPAADAHTLSIPAPLIKLATDTLELVKGIGASKVVVLLTPHFMYLQRPHTPFRDEARRAERIIPEAAFPEKLGFIEIPYSQGPGFFTNLVIYHEIGHFVYEELSTQSRRMKQVERLHSAMNNAVSKRVRSRSDERTLAYIDDMITAWTQEIFCDLFAIRLIGPAFSFALVEMLAVLGLLAEKSRIKFDREHPAPAYRIAEHVRLLEKDSWWDAIADLEPEQKSILKALTKIPRSKYTFDEEAPGKRGLVNVFLDSVVPEIRALIDTITPDPANAVNDFQKTRSGIEDCLRAGVVPHPKQSGSYEPVSVVNAAFCYYLTSLPKLVRKYEEPKFQQDVEKHSIWTDRLEKWTMKAVEDSQFLEQFWKMNSHGAG